MFWYLFWPAFFGGVWLVLHWKHMDKKQKVYFISFVTLSIILGIFYGSWEIQDSIAKNEITVGNSYARYWLPMYIMSLPLAVLFFRWAAKKLRTIAYKNIFATLLYIVFFALNATTAVFGADEGLYYTSQGIVANKQLTSQVLNFIENNAVVVSENTDKFIWPARKAMAQNIFERKTHEHITALLGKNVPVYYYGFILRPEHLELLNNERLTEFNLKIAVVEVYAEYKLGLYKLERIAYVK